MRADGLYGALIIHPGFDETSSADQQQEQLLYEDDAVLLIGDWYHHSAREVQDTYDTWTTWGLEPAPDSLLVNGHGSFNCSRLSKSSASKCTSIADLELKPRGQRSRVRVINVG